MIHSIAGVRLGDVWGSLNYYGEKDCDVSYWSCGTNLFSKISECRRVLPPFRCRFTGNKPTEKPPSFGEVLTCEPIKTVLQWVPGESKIICYQFDAQDPERVVPDEEGFIVTCRALGYQPINLGGYKPLRECVPLLVSAKCFIGANSGLSIVTRSVGTPMIVVTNGLVHQHTCPVVNTWQEALERIKDETLLV